MVVRLEDIMRDFQARRMELDREGVYFLGDITEDQAERFNKSLLLMATARQGQFNNPIQVYITSGGGSVGAGFSIIEMMNRMRQQFNVRIHTVVSGYAYSMGAIIFQAGDWRIMGPYSTLMLHSSAWTVSGQDDQIFRDLAKLSKMYRGLVGALFAERTGKNDVRWWERYIYSGRDKFLSAAECLELGLADEITSQIPWSKNTSVR